MIQFFLPRFLALTSTASTTEDLFRGERVCSNHVLKLLLLPKLAVFLEKEYESRQRHFGGWYLVHFLPIRIEDAGRPLVTARKTCAAWPPRAVWIGTR